MAGPWGQGKQPHAPEAGVPPVSGHRGLLCKVDCQIVISYTHTMVQAGRDLKAHLVPTMGIEPMEHISQMEIGLFSCDQSFSGNCCQRVCDLNNALISLNPFSIKKKQTG